MNDCVKECQRKSQLAYVGGVKLSTRLRNSVFSLLLPWTCLATTRRFAAKSRQIAAEYAEAKNRPLRNPLRHRLFGRVIHGLSIRWLGVRVPSASLALFAEDCGFLRLLEHFSPQFQLGCFHWLRWIAKHFRRLLLRNLLRFQLLLRRSHP